MIRSNFISVSGENWKAEQDRKRIERERIIELPKRERTQANYNLKLLFKNEIDYRPEIKSMPKKLPPKLPPKLPLKLPQHLPRKRKDQLKKALAEKIAMYGDPKKYLCISPVIRNKYRFNKTKFSEKEDRYILCKLYQIGMDTENVYDQIKQAIQNAWQFNNTRHVVFR